VAGQNGQAAAAVVGRLEKGKTEGGRVEGARVLEKEGLRAKAVAVVRI
jgi:hypothetical protein